MRIQSILSNSQRLDGGAMFGNCPKALWTRWVEVDDNNQIPLACRTLLVRTDTSNILVETGVGAFFEPKLAQRYGVVESEHCLQNNLQAVGLKPQDIDIIVLSHLHFDHAGGLLTAYQEGQQPELLFKDAHYVVSQHAWQRAKKPHPRDRASFIAELPAMLEATQRLTVVDVDAEGQVTPLPDALREWSFFTSDGHTPGMLLSLIPSPKGPVVYGADLIPGAPWVHLPITMGYDRYPEKVIEEKQKVLDWVVTNKAWLCFTHDASIAVAKVTKDERGRYGIQDPQPNIDWVF